MTLADLFEEPKVKPSVNGDAKELDALFGGSSSGVNPNSLSGATKAEIEERRVLDELFGTSNNDMSTSTVL